MAVYTSINFDELTSFLNSYDLSQLKSFKGISSGVTNTNYFIETDNSKYILTIFEQAQPKDIQFYVDLMSFLSQQKFNCPTPIANHAGHYLGKIQHKPTLLVSFLNGKELKEITKENCFHVGESLAHLHLTAKDYKVSLTNPRGLNWMNEVFQKMHHLLAEDEKNVISKELINLDQNFVNNLSSGIIHADLFPDNVFFLEGKLSGLIDFYFACHDMLSYDIAICLNAWCFERNGSFNIAKAGQIIKGYQSVRSLNKHELDALPILCRGAALRFLLTRLYDWLNRVEGALVKIKDPLEYLTMLKFHQKVTSVNDYNVDQS